MVRSKTIHQRRLQLLGEVERVGEKNIVVRTSIVPRLAAKVFNSGGKEVGYVSNIFGPVSKPFVTVKIDSDRTVKEGEPVYIEKA